ncbi:hypothetical protein HMPREF9996_00518 [Aggregatibacter actinomycetemcomitans Y4]|nr:hypothetical protein HMPREF9996_00518 [Aggregatibacter actinomycetemcomitans Y4]
MFLKSAVILFAIRHCRLAHPSGRRQADAQNALRFVSIVFLVQKTLPKSTALFLFLFNKPINDATVE